VDGHLDVAELLAQASDAAQEFGSALNAAALSWAADEKRLVRATVVEHRERERRRASGVPGELGDCQLRLADSECEERAHLLCVRCVAVPC
jgi:hypothetical protein